MLIPVFRQKQDHYSSCLMLAAVLVVRKGFVFKYHHDWGCKMTSPTTLCKCMGSCMHLSNCFIGCKARGTVHATGIILIMLDTDSSQQCAMSNADEL